MEKAGFNARRLHQQQRAMDEYTKIKQAEYEAKIKEIKNAPRFRKYIVELMEYEELLKTKPDLKWETFKKTRYERAYRAKQKAQKNNNNENENKNETEQTNTNT